MHFKSEIIVIIHPFQLIVDNLDYTSHPLAVVLLFICGRIRTNNTANIDFLLAAFRGMEEQLGSCIVRRIINFEILVQDVESLEVYFVQIWPHADFVLHDVLFSRIGVDLFDLLQVAVGQLAPHAPLFLMKNQSWLFYFDLTV